MASTYIPPIIEVYQEFKAAGAVASDPNLSAVVVGPCYHILTYAANKTLIAAGDYADADITVDLPSAKAGMVILASTDVKVYLDEAVVGIVDVADGAFTANNPNVANVITSATGDFINKKVAVGDAVSFDSKDYVVTEVVNLTTLKLNKDIDSGTNLTSKVLKITRKKSDMLLADAAANYVVSTANKNVALKSTATLSVDNLDRVINSAKIYIEYKALDVTYANEPASIGSVDQVTSKLGAISGDDNPLAMGAYVTFSNAQRKIYAVALESNDLTGWGKAVDVIKKRSLYAKAILSQDPAIIALFKVLEVANEDVKVSNYGISFGSHKVEDLVDLNVVPSSSTGATLADPSNSNKKTIFKDMSADFLASGVAAGDSITITAGGTGNTLISGSPYIVDQVISANQLKVKTSTSFAEFAEIATGLTYTIDRKLANEALATRIANVSKSLGHKRVVMVFPDYCQISGKKVPSYYCACVAAGMVAGLPSNAGLTYKGAAVVEKVFNSNFKFDYDQLNIIAGGGTLMFIQDDPDSLPYIRHQLTTDMTTMKSSEVSVIKNNDYVSFKFKATMKKFLGIYNVQEGLFIAMSAALEGDIEAMKRVVSTELGPILINASIVELKQSATNADQVEAVIDTTQPAPFNRGILRIIA